MTTRMYVCSTANAIIKEIGESAYRQNYGLLTTPESGHTPVHVIAMGLPWAMDNDAFKGFDAHAFLGMLRRYRGLAGCQWVAVPDVVADAEATMRRFYQWRQCIVHYGFKPALVAQDGLENMSVPWHLFDCLFIGGSTEWKLGGAARQLAIEAKIRGKMVHMGRVSSGKRIRYAQLLGCDSFDGSRYARFKVENRRHLPFLQSQQLTLWSGV